MGKDNKLHIVLLGRRNNGKSSLINLLTGQEIAIVSEIAGTTTDTVKRSYEIPDFASVIFIDTAGIDDSGKLGEKRIEKTRNAIAQADIAIVVIAHNRFGQEEEELINELKKLETPFIILHNKSDEEALLPDLGSKLVKTYNCPVIDFSTFTRQNHRIIEALKEVWKDRQQGPKSLIGDLLTPGDIVLLIAPIDSEAPAGRLILPQVQMIRDILDNHCSGIVLQPEEIASFLENTKIRPKMAITDSQVFKKVAPIVPTEIPLTSFSIVLARHKGNFEAYLEGTAQIENLKEGDRILMLESCSHHVSCEDIGRHKIPNWLQTYTGKTFTFDFIVGLDAITRPITDYAMVIQCGGCMITGKQLKNRLQPAIDAGIPVSNYGMTIAYLHGIFNRAIEIFKKSGN
ncbi:[FeFe] hydrogenase H-cluster maturation GTPase HydF [uncultured Sanguibacteroides sp.]|uniref:[FeFe] hydrogenase H-cluster maturation GTPase HydF n=1 Tax=uncultured Sanguibacteroides sp. TaxID=1635151 RepID=UPI0025DEF842|nr:[FeFe] hydrogenase H-cluster maturation GTPase HydF [uncultured Sanguibacteroides sp.]